MRALRVLLALLVVLGLVVLAAVLASEARAQEPVRAVLGLGRWAPVRAVLGLGRWAPLPCDGLKFDGSVGDERILAERPECGRLDAAPVPRPVALPKPGPAAPLWVPRASPVALGAPAAKKR